MWLLFFWKQINFTFGSWTKGKLSSCYIDNIFLQFFFSHKVHCALISMSTLYCLDKLIFTFLGVKELCYWRQQWKACYHGPLNRKRHPIEWENSHLSKNTHSLLQAREKLSKICSSLMFAFDKTFSVAICLFAKLIFFSQKIRHFFLISYLQEKFSISTQTIRHHETLMPSHAFH